MAETIEIRIRQQGARRVSRDISNIGRSAEGASRSVDLARRALQGLVAGAAVRGIVRTADAFQLLENRVRVFTDSSAEANARVDDLVDTAIRARVPLDGVATVFQRFSLVTQEMGISSETTAGVVENLAKAVAISGATSQEAEGALRQLSQGFAANRLSGQEFNAVAEQIPFVAKLIAQELGITTAELRALTKDASRSNETLITTDVILRALTGSTEQINRLFALVVPTVGQGLTALASGFTAFVGTLSQASGAGERFARFFQGLGRSFADFARDGDAVAELLERVEQTSTVLAVTVLPLLVRQVTLLGAAAARAAGRLALLAAANPFSALALAISAAVGFAVAFRDEVFRIGDTQVTLSALATVVGEDVAGGFSTASAAAEGFLSRLLDIEEQNFDLPNSARDLFNDLVRGFNIVARVAFAAAGRIFDSFRGVFRGLGEAFSSVPEAIRRAASGDFASAGELLAGAFSEGFGRGFEGFGDQVQRIVNDELAFDAFGTVENAVASSSVVQRAGQLTRIRSEVDRLIADNPELFGGGAPEDVSTGRVSRTGLSSAELDLLEKDFRELQTELDPALERTQEFAEAQLLLAQLLNGGRISLETYNDTLGRLTERLREEALEDFRALRAELDPQVEVLQTYQDRIRVLQTALNDGTISLAEFESTLALVNEDFREGILDLDESLENLTGLDAFKRGFSESLEELVEDAGSQTEILKEGFLDVFDTIGGTIKDVFTGAEVDAREFAANIIGEISQVVSRLIVLQLAQAALGGGGLGSPGGSVGGFFSQLLGLQGFQSGGRMLAGQTGVVGEGGPELFTAPRTGQVIPNDQLGAALNPSVNVQVVNVDDPATVLNAVSTREGEQVILNTIQRNSGKLRKVLGG